MYCKFILHRVFVESARYYKISQYEQTVGYTLDYYDNNHLPGNIFIYAPNQRVLMLADVIFSGWIPSTDLAVITDMEGFIRAHDLAFINYIFKTFNVYWRLSHKAWNKKRRPAAMWQR